MNMGISTQIATLAAALLAAVVLASMAPAQAPPSQEAELDELFEELKGPGLENWGSVEREIMDIWSDSGSAAMNLLLERGRSAMREGNLDEAIEHLSALTDHAPDFAEGWNARATAFYNAGQYGASIHDIRRTLELNPRHYRALVGLGSILEEIGEPERALAAYRAAQGLNPHIERVNERIEELENPGREI